MNEIIDNFSERTVDLLKTCGWFKERRIDLELLYPQLFSKIKSNDEQRDFYKDINNIMPILSNIIDIKIPMRDNGTYIYTEIRFELTYMNYSEVKKMIEVISTVSRKTTFCIGVCFGNTPILIDMEGIVYAPSYFEKCLYILGRLDSALETILFFDPEDNEPEKIDFSGSESFFVQL